MLSHFGTVLSKGSSGRRSQTELPAKGGVIQAEKTKLIEQPSPGAVLLHGSRCGHGVPQWDS